jgi:hypothetical protein
MPVTGSNLMKLADIRDKNTDYEKSNLELSILFSGNGLSYSLKVQNEMRFVALKSFVFEKGTDYFENCRRELDKIPMDSKYFETRFIVADNRQTLVPDAIYNEADCEKYWNLNFKKEDDSDIHSFHLSKAQTQVVFAVNRNIMQIINSCTSKKSLIPSAAPFVEFNYKRNRLIDNPEKSRMYVQVYDTFAEILVIENFSIKLFNTFSFNSQNDVLYHIINIFEQLRLNTRTSEIIFSGFIDTDSLAVLNLRKFVGSVYFESQNIGLRYYYQFQEIPPHYFFYQMNS